MNATALIAIPLLPLAAAVIAGLAGRLIGRSGAHTLTCLAVAGSCVLSLLVLKQVWLDGVPVYDAPLYTFAMLLLVMANNFMQLFFGWEAVGLVSYLLIGFWYTRPSATFAGLKAFIVNRIGDFGFVLGIAGIVYFTHSLAYRDAFSAAPQIAHALIALSSTSAVGALTLICICLFIGAMGKSAQVPLHVWLPDSMEGPTPISALIHAATMVTAGIFMVARMSPLFEYSDTA